MTAARPRKPFLLCVLDGFGLNPNPKANAIELAQPKNFQRLFQSSPSTTLVTHGERVGLPDGQMGNSEVGHLNIGAGRVVEQWLLRISNALKGGALKNSPSYKNFLGALTPHSTIHVMGLFSDGGVHSHSDHLYQLLECLNRDTARPVALHLITDGRDTSPHRAREQAKELEQVLKRLPRVKVATAIGRFFAMDRDKRWERVEKAYRTFVAQQGTPTATLEQAMSASYEAGITDEFLEPVILSPSPMKPDDGFIFFNFREDRAREIVSALCSENFSGFPRAQPPFAQARVLCFTEYDEKFHLPYLFAPLEIRQHLGEVVSGAGLSQLRTAETEKYPHVTYFLNGGIEQPYPAEDRALVPSPRDVKTYDLKPEMSAVPVTDGVVQAIESGSHDLIVVNLANCDMVGHTGVLEAAVKAVQTVDACLGRIVSALEKAGGAGVILADHGNAEQMVDYQTGAPHTSHTLYPVPFIVIGHPEKVTLTPGGALCDVAPTLLELMALPQPKEMTGKSLIRKA